MLAPKLTKQENKELPMDIDENIVSLPEDLNEQASFEKVNQRLDMIARELENQGVDLIKTMLQLKREAAKLAKQKSILESILDSMGEGVIVTDEKGIIYLINQEAQRITGISVLTSSLVAWANEQAFFAPDTDEQILAADNLLIAAVEDAKAQQMEMLLKKSLKDQNTYIRFISRPFHSTAGKLNGVVVVISDITERKKAELELKRSEQTKRALLEAIPDIMFRVNKEGMYLDYIPAKGDVMPGEAYIGNYLHDVLEKDIADKMMVYLKDSVEKQQLQSFEFQLFPDNIPKFYEARFTPINGEEALCIIRDVTKRIENREALKKSAGYYRRLVERSPAPIVVFNKDWEIVLINTPTLRLLGIETPEQLADKRLLDFVAPKDRMKAKLTIKKGYEEDVGAIPILFHVLRADKSIVVVEAVGSIINYKGQLVGQAMLTEVQDRADDMDNDDDLDFL